MKDPAFLFYANDFLSGTLTMSHEDRGKYILLLCIMHQQGRLSDETIRLLVGSPSVMLTSKFKKDENGLWFNERLEIEIEKRGRFVDSRRENGSKGGRPKEPIGLPNGLPTAKPKKNRKANLPVNVNEVINYFNENGYTTIAAEKFFKYYTEMKWTDSNGNKVLSWKGKAQSVWFKDENKSQVPVTGDYTPKMVR